MKRDIHNIFFLIVVFLIVVFNILKKKRAQRVEDQRASSDSNQPINVREKNAKFLDDGLMKNKNEVEAKLDKIPGGFALSTQPDKKNQSRPLLKQTLEGKETPHHLAGILVHEEDKATTSYMDKILDKFSLKDAIILSEILKNPYL